MDSKRILVVTGSRNVQRSVARALASTGNRTSATGWQRDAIQRRLADGVDMCIVDADADVDQLGWLLERLYEDHPSTISLLISRDYSSPALRDILGRYGLNHLIAKHGGVSASTEIIDEAELIVTCEKLFRRSIFGLDKYLSTWAVQLHEHVVRSTAQKAEAMDALEQFLEQIDCYGAIRPAVNLVADELLMNAIYNAPRDRDGEPRYAGRDRKLPLELDPGEEVVFCYGCDGKNIAMSIRDAFGSLDRELIIKYLERCFAGEKAVMESKAAGAGLGLYMVFNSITQLTFNIEQGVATEVIASFYARRGTRGLRNSGRSLNIFLLR